MSLRIWQLAVCVMHVHQVPVALGVAVVTRGLVTFERHVLSRMPHRRLGCHHRVDSCRWCVFCPSFVFAACQRLRFCQSPGFFLLQLVSRAGLHFPPMVWTAGVAAVMCQRPSRFVRCTSCEDHLRYNICYRTPRWAATILG